MKSNSAFSEMSMDQSASEMQSASGRKSIGLSRESSVFLLLLFACIVLLFHGTIFSGAPVSRASLIEQLDLLYNSALHSSELSVNQDPSACLQSIPRETFVQNSLARHDSPVWNPLSGCGQPVFGDPANTLFGPLDLIFSPGNQQLYNLGIVAKILVGSLFSCLLFLRSGAAPCAAFTAAIGFSLSARVLRGVELATNFEIVPAVFLVFACLKQNSSLMRIMLCALGLALCYSSLHPEVFFIAVSSASVMWIADAWQNRAPLRSAALSFGGLALGTVAMVAPFLFSFIEYLFHAQSYKYTDASTQFIPLEQLPFYLCVASVAGTLFPGWITLIGLVPGLLSKWKQRNSVIAVLLLLTAFACRPGYLADLFARAPFSYLLPEYALGTMLLLICLLCAIGLTQLKGKPLLAVLSTGIVFTPFVLCYLKLAPLAAVITSKTLIVTLVILLVAALALAALAIVSAVPKSWQNKALVVGGTIVLQAINIGSMIGPLRAELPVTTAVQFPPVGQENLIEKLKAQGDLRMLACGDRLLQPNTALIYGLADLRTCSPLNNKRYLEFMKAMGGKLGYCNMMQVPDELSPLADLASIGTVLSRTPLRSAVSVDPGRLPALPGSIRVSGRIMPGIRLNEGISNYNPKAGEIETELSMTVHAYEAARYQIQVFLCEGKSGREIWTSNLDWLSADNGSKHGKLLHFLLPAPTRQEGKVALLARLRDTWTGTFVSADGTTLKTSADGKAISLAEFELLKQDQISSPDGRFELVYETPELIRIYKNKNALPNAYLAHKNFSANSVEEALKKVCSKDFDARNCVVLEPGDDLKGFAIFDSPASAADSITVISDSNCEQVYKIRSKNSAVFVQTDTYYPGWTAELDGKHVDLFRANGLFRGVLVDEGEHLLRIRYAGLPVILGFLASSIALALTIGLYMRQLYNTQRQSKKE